MSHLKSLVAKTRDFLFFLFTRYIRKKKGKQKMAQKENLKNNATQENTAREQAAHPENKMGVMQIDKLLISMSLPMMISMLVQALYNIVDSIFVSQINEYALRAVSLAFPIQTLMIAVPVGTAVGINAFLSKTLGEKDFKKANTIAENGIFIEAGELYCVCPDWNFRKRPLLCQPDFYSRGAGVRYNLSDYLLCCRNRYFHADNL